MKNIFKSIMLFALIGLSAQTYSQVILNGGSFEPINIYIDYSTGYTVPEGKTLIITCATGGFFLLNGVSFSHSDFVNDGGSILLHIPIVSGSQLTTYSDPANNLSYARYIMGYLVDNDEWGAISDVPDEEIIDNDGGGIEIYPNPTDDLASVFVDYSGDWKMTVYDINGQVVLETQSETPVKSIDTNELSAGTYIVSVRAKRKLIGSSQLIVQ